MAFSGVWECIFGHEGAVASLNLRIKKGSVPQACLFVGPSGVGKKKVALALSAAMNCKHPSLSLLRPEGGEIRIDDIRRLRRSQAMRQDGHRFFIIDDAHLMNQEAANAFLKTLEEPNPGAHFVLITDRQDLLPETIVSRCAITRFSRLRLPALERLLVERFGFAPDEAVLYARLSGGQAGEAVALAGFPELLKIRSFAVDLLKALPRANIGELHRQAAEFAAFVDSVTSQAQKAAPSEPSLTKKAEQEDKRRRQRHLHHLLQKCYHDLFRYMLLFIRDSLLTKSGASEELLVNVDMRTEFPLPIATRGSGLINEVVSQLETARSRLQANVSPQLCLEALVFSLREEIGKQCQELSA